MQEHSPLTAWQVPPCSQKHLSLHSSPQLPPGQPGSLHWGPANPWWQEQVEGALQVPWTQGRGQEGRQDRPESVLLSRVSSLKPGQQVRLFLTLLTVSSLHLVTK